MTGRPWKKHENLKENRELTISDLSREMNNISFNSLRPHLDLLAGSEFIVRNPAEQNSIKLKLTFKGKKLLKILENIIK